MNDNSENEALIIYVFIIDPRNNYFFQYFKTEQIEK